MDTMIASFIAGIATLQQLLTSGLPRFAVFYSFDFRNPRSDQDCYMVCCYLSILLSSVF